MTATSQKTTIYRGDSKSFDVGVALPVGVTLNSPSGVYYVANPATPNTALFAKPATMTQTAGAWTASVDLTQAETLIIPSGRLLHFVRVSDGAQRATVMVGELVTLNAPETVDLSGSPFAVSSDAAAVLAARNEAQAAAAAAAADRVLTGGDRIATGVDRTAVATDRGAAEAAAAAAASAASIDPGAPGGVAQLDAGGKVPTGQLPSAVLGTMQFQGVWDAATNTPAIPAAAPSNKGFYYVVAVAGSTVVDGEGEWAQKDWLVSDGASWVKIDNTDQVTMVAGRRGDITLAAADLSDLGAANGAASLDATGRAPEAQMPASFGAMKTKLARTIWVTDFAPLDVDGETTNVAGMQAALDAGDTVFFPPGRYIVSGARSQAADGLKLRAGHRIYGAGAASVIVHGPSSVYALSANQYNGGTANVADNMSDIHIRDLTFVSETGVFGEHDHMLNLHAVSRVLVERVTFRGWRGDAIYIGSGNVNGIERHNTQIAIRDCLFDGVNSENRNGISVLDCDGLKIEGSRFVNTTKVGMPGAIDFEPNPGSTWAIIRNCEIRGNRFVGGNEAAIGLLLLPNSTLTTPIQNFIIEGNFIEKPKGVNFLGDGASTGDATPSYGVVFRNNTVRGATTPFLIDGARGVEISGNVFEECPGMAEIGYTNPCYDNAVTGNTFRRCGGAVTDALWVRTVDRLTIARNKFVDCGKADLSGGRAINFIAGNTGSRIYLHGNEISSPLGRATYPIGAGGYTFDNGSCEDRDNKIISGGSASDFVANGSRVAAAPAGGTWQDGNVVWLKAPVSRGAIGYVRTGGAWLAIASPGMPGPSRAVFRNYAVSESFDCASFDEFSLNVQAGTALTYNAPTGMAQGQLLTIRVRNGSGGAMGAITWNAVFKLAGAFVNPANGHSRSIQFIYDGAVWIERWRSAADTPN